MNDTNIHRDLLSRRWFVIEMVFIVFGLCFYNARGQQSVCARVKIEIQQEITLERDAFEARMVINNGLVGVNLENISVVVQFADNDGNAVLTASNQNDLNAKFFIRLQAGFSIPSTIVGGSSASIKWLIIPALGAAGSTPKGQLYAVGAKLTYKVGGVDQSIAVAPDYITVKPMPNLALDYFLPSEVYGDDPFTDFIEPSVPFSLGVRVKNIGFGTARNFKIESSQPKIVDNVQGLLVDFRIQSSEVNGAPATPSLLAKFGDVAASRAGVARWNMISTLSGRFVEFTANYTHADELGGELTSLFGTQPQTHFLLRDVLVDLPGRDAIRDFLAQDGDLLKVYESDNVDSPVTDQSSAAALTVLGNAVTIVPPPGSSAFLFIRKADPFSATRLITSAARADGKQIKSANVWLSQTWDKVAKHWNYFVNVFDVNNTAGLAYALNFGDLPAGANRPPKMDPIANRTVTPNSFVSIPLTATDPDANSLRFSLLSGPSGAQVSQSGSFTWQAGASGQSTFQVQVTDNGIPALSDSTSFTITVGNQRPIITLTDGALDYTENDGPKAIDPGATVSTPGSQNFNNGLLMAQFTDAPLTAEDRLSILSDAVDPKIVTITSGGKVKFNNVEIGSFEGGTDLPLTFHLNSGATASAIEALLQHISFEDISDNPSTSDRHLQFTLTDGDGQSSLPVSKTIHVLPVNDAPMVQLSSSALTVQYSDPVGPVNVTITDADSVGPSLTVAASYQRNGSPFQPGLPAGLAVVPNGPANSAIPSSAAWTLSGNVQTSPGDYTIQFTASDGQAPSAPASLAIHVTRENAAVLGTGPSSFTGNAPYLFQNVDSLVTKSFTGVRLNRTTSTFDASGSIQNKSDSPPIRTPLWLVVTKITPSSVTAFGPTGTTPDNFPYIDVPLANGMLAPNQSVPNIVLRFKNPSNVNFTYETSVRASAPNWSATTASLTLQARVTDILDGSPGDVRTGTITFYRDVAGDPAKILGVSSLPVSLLDLNDLTVGQAMTTLNYSFTAAEGLNRRADLVVFAVVDGNYTGASPAQNISIQAQPAGGLGGLALKPAIQLQGILQFEANPSAANQRSFQIRISGLAGERYSIQSSEDLSSWREIGQVQNETGQTDYLVPVAASSSAQFFKLELLKPAP